MIDTHTHIYLPEFDADRSDVIDRALHVGVQRMVLPNVDDQTLDAVLELERTNPSFFRVALGLHPTSVRADYKQKLEIIRMRLEGAKSCCAIGEIGFDAYWDSTYVAEQREAFSLQLKWAEEHSLPVIVHLREAFDLLFDFLQSRSRVKVPLLFHCFSGTAEEAARLLELCEAWFGINGVVTYKKSLIREVLPLLPLDRIVLETDAPYLAPVPFRGKRNEPAYLPEIASAVAALLGMAPLQVEQQTDANAMRLFAFDAHNLY